MKLYLLRPKEPYGHEELDDDPWKPWYDKTFGFVIRTENEKRAREIADSEAGAENMHYDKNYHGTEQHPWLDKKYSTCIEISGDGVEELVIRDFAAA